MKMVVFFLAGMVTSLLIVFAIWHTGTSVNAEGASTEDSSNTAEITALLPDIGKIYHACLTDPFIQVETEIHDPDIARYYHKLMQDTGLTDDSN
jgi:hypothetical protein